MSFGAAEKIADAVLYEGYLLYPYRQSAVKNQQRFNFGVLYPRAWCEIQCGAESWEMRTECLIEGPAQATIEVKTRFLQMEERGGWQEGREREVTAPPCTLESLAAHPYVQNFVCPPALEGELELTASRCEATPGAFKLNLRVRNLVTVEDASDLTREAVLLRSMVSAHSILHAAGGEFISLLDPPQRFEFAAAACQNAGAWPVLAGEEGQRDLILVSPIILYDYPQIAPESPNNLCDGAEIDEILALRILTLTDAEKQEVRNGDERGRLILERTEMLPPEHFQKLHGAVRSLRQISTEASK